MVAPGLAFAVPGLELPLFVVPASGLGSLPAAQTSGGAEYKSQQMDIYIVRYMENSNIEQG